MKSTFWTRLPITIIGIPLITYLLITGGVIFAGFVSLVVFLCLYEFYGFKQKIGVRPNIIIGMLMSLMICFFYIEFPFPHLTNMIAGITILIVLALLLEMFSGKSHPLDNITTTFAGVIYVAGLLGTMIALRNWDSLNGARFTMAMIFTVWICDSCEVD